MRGSTYWAGADNRKLTYVDIFHDYVHGGCPAFDARGRRSCAIHTGCAFSLLVRRFDRLAELELPEIPPAKVNRSNKAKRECPRCGFLLSLVFFIGIGGFAGDMLASLLIKLFA